MFVLLADGMEVFLRCGMYRTCNLPFRPILTPQAHAVLLIRDARLLVQLDDAGAEVGLAPLHGLVVQPDVVAPCFLRRVVGSVA